MRLLPSPRWWRSQACKNQPMCFRQALAAPPARAAFTSGARDTLMVIPSYVPFGLVCGVASVNAGLTLGASLALPALVYGGSSQAVLLQFVQSNASLWVAVLSGCVINLRLAVYSAAMASKVRHLGKTQRMLVAAFLVDNTFAFMQAREESHPHDKHLMAYYAGSSTVCWLAWVLFCAIGAFAGNIVPASWQLEFAIPLSFIAVAVPAIRNLPMGAAALVGGMASVLLFALPLKLGLIAACLAGLTAGILTQKWSTRSL
jgi:predicted branched-subunit amino acid permease